MFLYCKCYISIELTDVSERIGVNKTSGSGEHDICHYCYLLNKGFKFQPNVCNRCHDLLMMSMNLIDIAILNIKSSDYRCIISGISKNQAINLMQNANLTVKAEHYKTEKFIITYKNGYRNFKFWCY